MSQPSQLAPSIRNYVIGRGSLYFDRFDSNMQSTGELDLGNAKDFGFQIATTQKEHYSTRSGIKEVDQVIDTELKVSTKFTLEEISNENLMLALHSPLSNWNADQYLSQNAGTIVAGDPMTIVARQNRWVKLSKGGVDYRNIQNGTVVVKDGATTFSEGQDYKIDYATGRLFTMYDGQARTGQGIYDNESLTITLSYGAIKYPKIITAEGVTMEGFFRFVSNNPVGPNYEVNIWDMKIKCSSEVKLIADDYSSLAFDGEAKRDVLNHPTSPFWQILEVKPSIIIS